MIHFLSKNQRRNRRKRAKKVIYKQLGKNSTTVLRTVYRHSVNQFEGTE